MFAELRDLPKNVSSMMSAAKQEMTRSLSQVMMMMIMMMMMMMIMARCTFADKRFSREWAKN